MMRFSRADNPRRGEVCFMKANTLLALAASVVLAASVAEARITKVQITAKESPTFGGYSWPGVGQYEKIVGKAFGELNPADPSNAVIVDIELAPLNANGKVDYSFDFYILKPINLGQGAHRVMYEPPNRGRKTWQNLGRVSSGGNDPGSITDPTELANAFLMPRGYTLVWSGWDKSAGTSNANFNTTITLPIAKNHGATITGPSQEYFVTTSATATSLPLSYPPFDRNDKTTPKLTHRVHLNDTGEVISSWNSTPQAPRSTWWE